MKRSGISTSTKTRGRHRSPAEWRGLLSAHEQSGLTQAAFCEREGISQQSLLNWRKRLGRGADTSIAQLQAAQRAMPAFVELGSAIGPLDAGLSIRLELGGGVVLELSRR
jgi:hypothetical protein